MFSVSLKSRNSPLQKLDGRTKLIALAIIFILVLLFTDLLYITALLVLVLAAWFIAQLPTQPLKEMLQFFVWIAVIILIVQVFFYPGTTNLVHISKPLPAIGFSGYLTLEGILFGLAMVLRLVVIMIVAPLMVMTTPLPELMLALVKLKIPYKFAFIMTTALSLLPSIQNRSAIIQQAQLCRGISYDSGGKFLTKLKASVSLLIPLILGAFRDSQTLEVAMNSRAFGAPIRRTFLLESHFTAADILVITGAFMLLAAGIYLRPQGFGVY